MAALRQLLYPALLAGLLCGIFASIAHQLATVPLILQAETYESAARRASPIRDGDYGSAAWSPENGLQRATYTAAADILAGTGFALLLAAGISLRGGDGGWREGLFWGLAGFAACNLAPGLGMPPALPGSAAAPLPERQLWWLMTAVATGGGLALFAFGRRPLYALLGAALIVLPQLKGAPQPAEPAAAIIPAALTHRFAVATTVISFLFWAALGALTGFFCQRFATPAYGGFFAGRPRRAPDTADR